MTFDAVAPAPSNQQCQNPLKEVRFLNWVSGRTAHLCLAQPCHSQPFGCQEFFPVHLDAATDSADACSEREHGGRQTSQHEGSDRLPANLA